MTYLRLFLFSFRSSTFGLYGDVTTDGEGLLNLGLCSAPNAFGHGDIYMYYLYRATPVVTRDLGLCCLSR